MGLYTAQATDALFAARSPAARASRAAGRASAPGSDTLTEQGESASSCLTHERLSTPATVGATTRTEAALAACRARGQPVRGQRGTRFVRHGRRLSCARPLDRRGARSQAVEPPR